MTNEELLSVAEIVERLVTRLHEQAANHEAKMVEHRAAFGVRTTADAKIIAGLRGERDGLLTQVQDMRAEIERLQWENKTMHKDAEDGYAEAIKVLGDPIGLSKERDALRAEVAELKAQLDRLTSWAAKNQAARETLQSEIDRLKSQTPKQHPVKAGEYVRRLTGFNTTPAGEIAQVIRVHVNADSRFPVEYDVLRPNGETGTWIAKNCAPCDPPEGREVGKGNGTACACTLCRRMH